MIVVATTVNPRSKNNLFIILLLTTIQLSYLKLIKSLDK